MYYHYFYWQFIAAPAWLLRFFGIVQLMLTRFFSVSIMVRTLFAYWHKDSVSLRKGTVGGILQALAWNAISRTIGFIVRTTMLACWAAAAVVAAVLSLAAFITFVLWPVLIAAGIAAGIILITG